jgi:hypothetical protein
LLKEFVKMDNNCVKAVKSLIDQKTSFGWEEPLVKIYN